MTDPESGWTEADITINGVALNLAQSMVLRVAMSDFLMRMSEPNALGDDKIGRNLADGYRARITEVVRLTHKIED